MRKFLYIGLCLLGVSYFLFDTNDTATTADSVGKSPKVILASENISTVSNNNKKFQSLEADSKTNILAKNISERDVESKNATKLLLTSYLSIPKTNQYAKEKFAASLKLSGLSSDDQLDEFSKVLAMDDPVMLSSFTEANIQTKTSKGFERIMEMVNKDPTGEVSQGVRTIYSDRITEETIEVINKFLKERSDDLSPLQQKLILDLVYLRRTTDVVELLTRNANFFKSQESRRSEIVSNIHTELQRR